MNKAQLEILSTWVSSWLEQQRRNNQIPGLAYSIFNADEILIKGGLGFADLEEKVKVDPLNTLFRLASISKSITSLGIARLWQEGKLDLDDRLGKYLDLKEIGLIRLRSLLSHNSGLKRDGKIPFWDNDVFPDTEELLLEARSSGNKVFGEDRKYKYSNFAYALLGQVIERVSGQSYEKFIDEEIIEKLGLKNYHCDVLGLKAQDRKKLATGYGRVEYDEDLSSNRIKYPSIPTMSYASAVGHTASAIELAILVQQFFKKNESLLGAKTKQVLLKGRKVEKYPDDVYALGVKVWKSGNNRLLGHGGSFMGFRCYYAICPKYSFGAVVLSNSMSGAIKNMVENLIAMSIKVKILGKGSERYSPYEGMFSNRWSDIQILNMGGALHYYDMNSIDPVTELIKLPGRGGIFIDENASGGDYKGEPVEFVFNNRGLLKHVRFGSTILHPKYWK